MTEFLDVPGGRIAYDVTGSGPLVVLPPGIGVRRQAYRFLAPVLAQAGYRVATADLRGHGESSMGWAAIHRHRRRRRPARPGRSPGRARGHRRVLALRRRGDHRRGDAAGAGRRDRRDQPVHQETEVRPGRAAADPPLPPVRLPADRHAGVPQPGPVAALPQPGLPHQARRLRRLHSRAGRQAARTRPDGRVPEDLQVHARRRRSTAAPCQVPGPGHHGHAGPRLRPPGPKATRSWRPCRPGRARSRWPAAPGTTRTRNPPRRWPNW